MDDLQITSTVPFSAWPSTLVGNIWVYDPDHPATLYASVVKAEETKTTVEINCPTSISGCGDDFAPQTITRYAEQYYAASLMRGERTADGTTTSWVCDMMPNGSSMGDDGFMNVPIESGQELKCAATTGKNLKVKELKPTAFHGECFSKARQALALTTAGLEELKDVHPYFGQQQGGKTEKFASELLEIMVGDFESVCTDEAQLEDAQVTKTRESSVAAKTSSGEVKETGNEKEDEEEKDQKEEGDGAKSETEEKSDDQEKKEEDEEKDDDDSGSVKLSAASVSMGLMVITAAFVNL